MSSQDISRVTRSKQGACRVYNQMSRWYDFIAGGSEQRFMDLGIRQLQPLPGEQILEIGCGTGHGVISLSQAVSNSGYVVGLDISDGMLIQAQKQLEIKDLPHPIHLLLGDACLLPFTSHVFSAIFCSFTMELFDTPEIPVVLAECTRILKEGGRMGIVSLLKNDSFPVRFYEMFHKIMPSFVDCRPIVVQPFLRQADFEITTSISKNMWGLPVEIVIAKVKNDSHGGEV